MTFEAGTCNLSKVENQEPHHGTNLRGQGKGKGGPRLTFEISGSDLPKVEE